MKKLFGIGLLLIALILLSSAVMAEGEGTPISKGLKVGGGFAKWTGSDATLNDGAGTTYDAKYRTGFTFGGFVSIPVSPSISIQPEVLYQMKGTKYEEADTSATFKINYIEIPVLIKYNFQTSGNMTPAIFVGPALGIKASSKLKLEAGSQSGEVDLENVKSTDFNVQFGGELGFASGSMTYFFDFRYYVGLTKIAGSDENSISPDAAGLANDRDLKNSGFNFLLGVGF